MTIALLVVGALLVMGIIALIVIAVKKNAIQATLGALVAALTGLIGGSYAPTLEGDAAVNLQLGSWVSITGHVFKVSTGKPFWFWIATYFTLLILILACIFRLPKAP
jgi:hypothetical protein